VSYWHVPFVHAPDVQSTGVLHGLPLAPFTQQPPAQ
jgi:hypothetical protein